MSKRIEELLPVKAVVHNAVWRVLILTALLLSFELYVVTMHPVRMSLLGISKVIDNIMPVIFTLIALPIFMKYFFFPPNKPVTPDADLLIAARFLADRLGVTICEVRILEGDYGKRHTGAWMNRRNKIILITRKSFEILSKEETAWVLAHELAHLVRERLAGLRSAIKLSQLASILPFLFWLVRSMQSG